MTERLYRLDAACHVCRAPLPVRVAASEIRAKLHLPPEAAVQTVRCIQCTTKHRRITIVTIRAGAYQRAVSGPRTNAAG